MKRNLLLQICITTFFSAISFLVFSQNVVIDYQAWNPTSPPCNIFGTGTNVPATIGGTAGYVMHYGMQGQPEYNSTQKAIALRTISTQAPDTKKEQNFHCPITLSRVIAI